MPEFQPRSHWQKDRVFTIASSLLPNWHCLITPSCMTLECSFTRVAVVFHLKKKLHKLIPTKTQSYTTYRWKEKAYPGRNNVSSLEFPYMYFYKPVPRTFNLCFLYKYWDQLAEVICFFFLGRHAISRVLTPQLRRWRNFVPHCVEMPRCCSFEMCIITNRAWGLFWSLTYSADREN